MPAEPIDEATLARPGWSRRQKSDGVRLLAKGEMKRAVTITVSGASATAMAAVAGGGRHGHHHVRRRPSRPVST